MSINHKSLMMNNTYNRKIDANKPDITIKDYKNNSCLLVELMFLMDKNLSSGKFEKI